MGLRISTNVASIDAQRNLTNSRQAIQKSFAQLSSGSRITKSADDPAGLAISDKLQSDIKGYREAKRNAQDGTSMLQVAEGGLNTISDILIRFRELGVQAASDTVGPQERKFIDKEAQQLKLEIQRIAQSTRFGGTHLLDGTGGNLEFQVGINNNDFNDRIQFNAGKQSATLDNLGIADFDLKSRSSAQDALDTIAQAQGKVAGMRANLGALQNRLQLTQTNLGVSIENYAAANSRIRDTDIARATSELAKNSVLLNAGTAVVAQANATPQAALKLIG